MPLGRGHRCCCCCCRRRRRAASTRQAPRPRTLNAGLRRPRPAQRRALGPPRLSREKLTVRSARLVFLHCFYFLVEATNTLGLPQQWRGRRRRRRSSASKTFGGCASARGDGRRMCVSAVCRRVKHVHACNRRWAGLVHARARARRRVVRRASHSVSVDACARGRACRAGRSMAVLSWRCWRCTRSCASSSSRRPGIVRCRASIPGRRGPPPVRGPSKGGRWCAAVLTS